MDEDGYYRITGRIKDMIIRGGENIYPREIEEFLYTMPGIEDVQVVGVPDEKYGEVVGAFVRLKAGADLTEGDVQEYARARMARYKAPKYVFFVDEFPMTASGKIQKYKLRDMAKDSLGIDIGVFSATGRQVMIDASRRCTRSGGTAAADKVRSRARRSSPTRRSARASRASPRSRRSGPSAAALRSRRRRACPASRSACCRR